MSSYLDPRDRKTYAKQNEQDRDKSMTSEAPKGQLDSLLAEAIKFHREGQLTKAEWKYEEILDLEPEHPEALHLLGVLANQLGNPKLAIERIRQSLAISPQQSRALNNLGNVHAEIDQHEKAIESYKQALVLTPGYAQAHHNLGNVYSDCNRIAEAIASYNRAIELAPEDNESRLALGATLEAMGEFHEAITQYSTVAATDLKSTIARHRLGAVFRKQHKLKEAIEVYRELLLLCPDDPVVTHLLASCGGSATPAQASNGYVKSTFDGFAADFDNCLEELQYKVPELLHKLLKENPDYRQREDGAPISTDKNIVDLGCGTGLCGSFLREYAGQLVGVDLSPGMLHQAGEKNIYDELLEMELTDYLSQSAGDHNLLIAADTLIYIGDLRPVFSVAHEKLAAGGLLLFSIEQLAAATTDADYVLSCSGRYAHKESVVRAWLSEAGFECQQVVETQLRQEGNEDVAGYLVMAFKP